jgi:hypothetical protein
LTSFALVVGVVVQKGWLVALNTFPIFTSFFCIVGLEALEKLILG